MILRTGPRPLRRGTSGRTARMLPMSGFWMPIAIMATRTATMIDRHAEFVSKDSSRTV